MRHTQKQIENMVKLTRLCHEGVSNIQLGITHPGDGVTRYEFFTPGPRPYTFGRSICYCTGAREAWLFLHGWNESRFERDNKVEMVDQTEVSGECFYIQIWGSDYCADCIYRDHDGCGGKNILRIGKNSLGYQIPLQGKQNVQQRQPV